MIKITLKVLEAFAGVGSQRMALRNLGIKHEVVAISEIDKFAIQSYEAIHGETHNIGDISKVKVEDIPDHDLFTYSFPCQDISIAGQGKGFSEDSDTRSSLLWECRKVIKGKKPKYLLMENVKNLVGKRFKPDFMKWLAWLETQGYTNYWDVLNAKDYGVPQSRERVFVVSILGEHKPYNFPDGIELDKRLKDVLKEEVEEKFYLNKKQTDKLVFRDDVPTGDIKQVAQYNTPTRINAQVYRTYDPSGIAATLNTMGGGGREPHVKEEHNPEIKVVGNLASTYEQSGRVHDTKGISPTVMGNNRLNSTGGYDATKVLVPDEPQVYDDEGITRTVKAGGGSGNIPKTTESQPFRIRKLTPLECWRLMGFTDEDFYKAESVCSNSQLYKQAGNSIVVDVLEGIFESLFKEDD